MTAALELERAVGKIEPEKILRAVLSEKKDASSPVRKITVRRIPGGFQAERFTDTQVFHENLTEENVLCFLRDALSERFRQLHCVCAGYELALRVTKSGKLLQNRKRNDCQMPDAPASHNREKNYLLKDGSFVPALYELGIMTSDGTVRAPMQDKFRQINRFVESVDDVLRDDPAETLEIVDFGCGKSYLTFLLYHYLTKVAHRSVRITGLDLKRSVIENCTRLAEKYGYEGLRFFCGDIRDYTPNPDAARAPDMVVTLHACDTATDYALYHAIRLKSRYIFSVPCCQHELNGALRGSFAPPLTDYGLIRERFAALATDGLRAKLLELSGYKTDVLEFVDLENSPKNLLLRARFTGLPNRYRKELLTAQIRDFSDMLGAEITLQRLLFSDGGTQ